MGPVGSLSLLNTLCPPPAPRCCGPFPPLQPPLRKPGPAGKFLPPRSPAGGARDGGALRGDPPIRPPEGLRKARGGWSGPVFEEGSSPCRGVVVPVPSRPPERRIALDFAHPKGSFGLVAPPAGAGGSRAPTHRSKTSCRARTGAAGRAGWAERGSFPSPALRCLRGGGRLPGSFLAAPTPEGCRV